jgi:hypothetical protein
MPAKSILDFNADQGPEGAWEPVRHEDADGADIAFRGAAVRFGGSDTGALYHVDTAGTIYHAEVGDTDDGEAVPFLAATKFFDLGGVGMAHSCYLRLQSVADTATLTVRCKGSEYGDLTQAYTVDLEDTEGDEKEARVRLHRELLGRYMQLELSGDFEHRPEIRDWTFLYIPVRSGRVSA